MLVQIPWLVASMSFAAEGDAPPVECFPPCSPGYLCHQGACIEACNPPCAEGFRCGAERICELVRAPEPAPSPEPVESGEGTLCIVRQPSRAGKWDIKIDHINRGIVGSNRYVCLPVPAGEHTVQLIQTEGGAGWLTELTDAPTVQLAPNVTSAILVARDDASALLCDVKVKATSVHLMCDPVAGRHAVDALLAERKPERR